MKSKRPPPVLAPGSRVVVRDEEWLVRGTRPSNDGAVAVHVIGLSELVRNKEAVFLSDLDEIEELAPEKTRLVHDPSPRYQRSRLYLESLLRRTPPTDARLHLGHRAAMDMQGYQLVPAARALELPRPRLLIADGVGLGKTLEVGVLLSELAARGLAERILVVTLKSILTQFQQEMWARFAIPLVRLDSVGLERVAAKIPSSMNPFHYFNRVIISVDTLKKDEKYRRHLEACRWDVCVIDECQNVAVKQGGSQRSQRSRLASLLARTADALVLTSATPHDGTPESFASLVNLLEPTAIADPSHYGRDDVQAFFVRRFKRDVAGQTGKAFLDRHVTLEHVAASPEEDAAFDALAQARFQTLDQKGKGGDRLFATTLLKAFLSSPQALASTLQERAKRLAHDTSPQASHDRDLLGSLEKLALAVTPARFTKLGRLAQLFKKDGLGAPTGKRVVVFSERIQTLELLERELPRLAGVDKTAIALFHGSLDDQEQQDLVADFARDDGKIRVLLASDAASEGINLHYHCHHLVHFDVPWSLITMEQRNGRIDRYGQRHTPVIAYLLTTASNPDVRGDQRVIERLVEREKSAHDNLGDVGLLMNLHDASLEEDRVARGIAGGLSPEQIVPEAPPEEDDFLSMLEEIDRQEAETRGDEVDIARPLGLFGDDDLAYARAVVDEINREAPRSVEVDWGSDHPQAILSPPDDLRRRLAYLPREAFGKAEEIKLTTDRELVKASYARARERGQWPEWQLLWPLHPVASWLNERALSLFTRHEAPVLSVPRGLAQGSSCFVMQGVLSNSRSQPLVVDWFGLVFSGSTPGEEVPLEQLAPRVGLDRPLVNAHAQPALAPLASLLPRAVEAARGRMARLRKERDEQLKGKVLAELRRVKGWCDRRVALLSGARDRAVRDDQKRALTQELDEATRTLEARMKWVNEGLRTVELPYVRVAAVLVPAG